MFGLGLLGEYVGRIYHQVRDRPRYVIRAVLEREAAFAEPSRPPVEPASNAADPSQPQVERVGLIR